MSLSGATTLKRFFQFIAVILILTWAVSLPAFAQNNNAVANKLFVETVRLVQKADAEKSPKERVRLYEQALKNLDLIVSKYPYTELSVKLITGQAIGNFSRSSVHIKIQTAKAEIQKKVKIKECLQKPVPCFIGLATKTARRVYDSEERIRPLIAIAVAKANSGNQEKAKIDLAEVNEIILRDVKPRDMGRYYVDLVEAQIKIGDLPSARKIAEKTKDSRAKYWMDLEIAIALAEAGKFQDALITMNKLPDELPHKSNKNTSKKSSDETIQKYKNRVRELILKKAKERRDNTFLKIAELQIKAGKFSDALTTLQKVSDQPATLPKIAEIHFRNGKIKEAKLAIEKATEATNKMKDSLHKAKTYVNIAMAQQRMGITENLDQHLTRSIDVINKNSNVFSRVVGLILIGISLQENRFFPESRKFISLAKKNVEKIEKNRFFSIVQMGLAKFQRNAGDRSGARTTIQNILESKDKWGDSRNALAAEIAYIQASMNDVEDAFNTAGLISNKSDYDLALKATALAEIATILAEKNKKK